MLAFQNHFLTDHAFHITHHNEILFLERSSLSLDHLNIGLILLYLHLVRIKIAKQMQQFLVGLDSSLLIVHDPRLLLIDYSTTFSHLLYINVYFPYYIAKTEK